MRLQSRFKAGCIQWARAFLANFNPPLQSHLLVVFIFMCGPSTNIQCCYEMTVQLLNLAYSKTSFSF
jgi:hypothetical protein